MALLRIMALLLAVQYAYGMCDVPVLFVQSVGETAQSGEVLTITYCPNPNVQNALGRHTCTGTQWYPTVRCVPGPAPVVPVIPVATSCNIPPFLQIYTNTATMPVGYDLIIQRCDYGGYPGTHRCTRSGQFSPPIGCNAAQPQPPVVQPPRPGGGIDFTTLLLLSQITGGGDGGFNLCSIFSFLPSCDNNSTSNGGRKKRYVELEEMNLNEEHRSKGRGSWGW